MIATGTLAGQPLVGSHNLTIESWLWRTEVRVEALAIDAAVGDELVVTLDGTPSIVAHVTEVGQRVGHGYLAAEPLIAQELRGAVSRLVGPLNMDDMRPSEIGLAVLDFALPVTVQPALDAVLDRWSTREREAAWCWRSLLRAIAVRTGKPVAWRHDARADTVIVEADRADWQDAAAKPLLRNVDWTVLEAAPIQPGDLFEGLPVVYVRTRIDGQTHETRIQTEET